MAFELPDDGRFRPRKPDETAEHYFFEVIAFYNLGQKHARQIATAVVEHRRALVDEERDRD